MNGIKIIRCGEICSDEKMNCDVVLENGAVLLNSEVVGTVSVLGDEAIVEKCRITATVPAIRVRGSGVIIKGNIIHCSGASIILEDGCECCLVAQNETDSGIEATSCFNCSFILNRADTMSCQGNRDLYIIENSLRGLLSIRDNEYAICDKNKFDSLDAENNYNVNGDTLTDINERAKAGALRSLQPHTDKDLFLDIESRFAVNDSKLDIPLGEYLCRLAENNEVVIVPPGLYRTKDFITFTKKHSNTKIYAYGVCELISDYTPALYTQDVNNLHIFGLTIAYNKQSCGQIHLLEEIDDRTFTAVVAAGMDNDFGRTDKSRFNVGFTDVFSQNALYPWGSIGGNYTLEKNPDATMTLRLGDGNLIGQLHAGDVIACRLGGANGHTVRVYNSVNVSFKDLVTYGYAAALAMVGGGETEGVSLERWHNTNRSAPIIDKDTYNRYRALEEKYGVSLDVCIDSKGRCRGGIPRVGSVDATHVIGARQGFNVTSSLLEAMVDDGSNQRASSSRLGGVQDNGDGTLTLLYKSNISEVYYKMGNITVNCSSFVNGDRIFIYTSQGRLVCDTECVSDSELLSDEEYSIPAPDGSMRHYKLARRTVKVLASEFDMSALDGYDLSDNHYSMTNRVTVDNLSRNSSDFTFDNVTVRNTRSRGMLIKSTGVTVKNCTFQNLAHTGLYLSTEKEWGESTVCRDIVISHCVIDHVGFINNYNWLPFIAPIAIVGLSSTVSENTLLYKNILIDGNRFINNDHDYQITVNSAQNVRIVNNLFAPGLHEHEKAPKKVILVDTAMNVEISNNRYSKYLGGDIAYAIEARNYKNVGGTDITFANSIN